MANVIRVTASELLHPTKQTAPMITAGMMELRLLASFRTLVIDRCLLEISQSNSTEANMDTSMPIRYGRALKYEF